LIAVDTNILVYAHRADSPWHRSAAACVKALAEARSTWGIPWPCLHEFLAIATHPRIYAPASSQLQAVDQVEAWLESPSLSVLGESDDHWSALRSLALAGKIAGPAIHDARIAAICLGHGIRELLTADRDFSRFPSLVARNPLVS
jgi:toxin-antitoxin system PIN domain toxin